MHSHVRGRDQNGRMRSTAEKRLLVTLALDAAGVTALTVCTLAGRRYFAGPAAIGGVGVGLAGLAVAGTMSRRGGKAPVWARALVLAGLLVNTAGSMRLIAGRRHPPARAAAVALLIAGDALSSSYLRAMAPTSSASPSCCHLPTRR